MLLLGIAVAGAVGAPARFLLEYAVGERWTPRWPVGTFLVNVTGSFVLGLLTGLALYHALPSAPKTVLGTGFCGAYTTFSTFTYETVRLAERRDARAVTVNVLASLVVPVLAAALGWAVAAL